ncbi:hypothetical protein N1851_024928 [Merluccius polli]|uniref:Uncharacterized protein n=1 Tax=Merluccius polli TaxID=89951 RepID=A0AA47NU21_MERPO|nr:hypothetical protein N1851_024928 [Merluccius polli]
MRQWLVGQTGGEKRKEASDDTSVLEIEKIVVCGYTGPVAIQRKEEIVRAVVLHATIRLVPILQQLCTGLKIYNLLDMIRAEKDICRQFFVQDLCRKRKAFSPFSVTWVDADFLVSSLSPIFSETGSVKRQREARIVNDLQDYIQDLEDKGADEKTEDEQPEDAGSENIDVGKFCQWLTGQSHVPLGAADREEFKILIEFDHDCRVRYVAHLGTSAELRDVLSKAVVYGYDFVRC